MSLFKLRNTWPQYFPTAFLHQLDLTVKELDPNWPVVDIAPPSGSIHINPKFLVKVCHICILSLKCDLVPIVSCN